MKKLLITLIGVFGAALLLVGVNMIAERSLAGRHADLTAQKLYSLSPGTRNVLAGLRDPITLRLYYSARLGAVIPQYGAHADRVREMLRQYAELSGGKIRLEINDPEPFSDAEDRATGYGLQGLPLEQGNERAFFGLQGNNLLDDERTIAFFQPERERFLEYDLTRLVYELSRPTRPVVGVLTPLKMDGDPQQILLRAQGNPGAGAPWTAMLNLRQNFAIRSIAADAVTVDPDVQVLLLVHPQNLSDATLYAIDQFVMRGGRLMAMVGPYNETLGADPQTGAQPAVTSSNLEKLFKAWGIVYDPDRVVGDLTGAWKVRAGVGARAQPVDYVAYFSVRDGINHDDPATADLSEVMLAAPGFLEKAPNADIEFTPLLTSSARSAVIPASAIRTNPDPVGLLAAFKPDAQRRVLAARIRGTLHSAFDKAPDGATEPYRSQSIGPANLVVIADTDMLADRFWTRTQDFFGTPTSTPFADNGTMVTNLVGTLAGGDALIGLRSRGGVSRPFERVESMQRDAEAQYRQTETALTQHLDDTTKQLDQMRSGHDGTSNAALNDAQRTAIDGLKRDLVETRGKLRQVQLELRRDIQALQTRLRLFDIALVPGLMLVLAIAMGLLRRMRRSRRPA